MIDDDTPAEDCIGDSPKAEALRELHCFAESAANGNCVLTVRGRREMEKLAASLARRLRSVRDKDELKKSR
jgi:hypothetical protein